MLHAIDDDAEARVDDAELGIESHRRGEEDRPVGAGAAEEIAIVEIAVGPREGHRLACLVQRIIIAFCQHRPSSRLFLHTHGTGASVTSRAYRPGVPTAPERHETQSVVAGKRMYILVYRGACTKIK